MYNNQIAKILFVIGLALMGAGVISGLLLINMPGTNWSTFFSSALGGFVSGMLFIGFAENIRLLQSIHDRLTPETETRESETLEKQNINDRVVQWTLEDSEKEKISDYYRDEVVDIIPSPKTHYCLVQLRNEQEYYVKVVYIGGFGVQETENAAIRHDVIAWYNAND
ncbi:hypothetical protein GCM10008983_16450 [Lentibacillus halophilus]|uniref:Uncharacterized protein n=1 Tax=Lentibacillus halophilus TaxID=295065 RepID=A0ABP3J3I5_9BACI